MRQEHGFAGALCLRTFRLRLGASPMKCPTCGAKSKIIDSRLTLNNQTRRRYACLRKCKFRWTTIEVLAHNGDMRGKKAIDVVGAAFENQAKKRVKGLITAILRGAI